MDVDGSYLWRKQQQLKESGVLASSSATSTVLPTPPLSGWVTINESNYKEIAKNLPIVTSGMRYPILICVRDDMICASQYRYCLYLPFTWSRSFSNRRRISRSHSWLYTLGKWTYGLHGCEHAKSRLLPCSEQHETFHEARKLQSVHPFTDKKQ